MLNKQIDNTFSQVIARNEMTGSVFKTQTSGIKKTAARKLNVSSTYNIHINESYKVKSL